MKWKLSTVFGNEALMYDGAVSAITLEEVCEQLNIAEAIKSRQLIRGKLAEKIYCEATDNERLSGFGKTYAFLGGYFQSNDNPSILIAFDFTNGDEVYIEEFTDELCALRFALGVN